MSYHKRHNQQQHHRGSKNKTWINPGRNVFTFDEDEYHDQRSGLKHNQHQSHHHQDSYRHQQEEYQTPLASSYQSYQPPSRYGQGSRPPPSTSSYTSHYERPKNNVHNQPTTSAHNQWSQPGSSNIWNYHQQQHQKQHHQQPQHQRHQYQQQQQPHYHQHASFSQQSFQKGKNYAQQQQNTSSSDRRPRALTTKYFRKLPYNARARPGLRNFCSYTTKRTGCSKLNHTTGKLQFYYKIRSSLWHRTKMGLHKKKTKLAAKQSRYRELKKVGFYFRKVHSQYWSKNSVKPKVKTKAINPWRSEPEIGDQRYLKFIANYTPISWQEPKYAYFCHLEYQLYLTTPNGLEYNSLSYHLSQHGLEVLQAVRLQNLVLFGSYMSKKQQHVANGLALAEVIRYFCIDKDRLKQLCKFGFDSRRLGHSNCFTTARLAHENRPHTNVGVVMVAARVITVPVKHMRSANEVYPEYIIQYRDDNQSY